MISHGTVNGMHRGLELLAFHPLAPVAGGWGLRLVFKDVITIGFPTIAGYLKFLQPYELISLHCSEVSLQQSLSMVTHNCDWYIPEKSRSFCMSLDGQYSMLPININF